jgi:hypothetical protein
MDTPEPPPASTYDRYSMGAAFSKVLTTPLR